MPVMESTTLITFMLQHPNARKVELLGSWDNFTEPYNMDQDRRRGRGYWSGCHSFRNIICDGDVTEVSEKRAGGLRMGGTYWYFYRIDGNDEFHDPCQQTTTACPLMPGQTLNVLEVPLETQRFTSHSRASSISISSIVQTLNPDDRYQTPRPAPKPILPKLITSAEAATTAGHLSPVSRGHNRPWSALPANGREDDAKSWLREIKSASASPTDAANVLKTAFQHFKGPASALTPSQGGRGRSRILYGDHLRSQRTKSPSARELRSQISRPMSMDSVPRKMMEIERRSEMASTRPQPLIVQKRSPSPNLLVRRLQENDAKVLEKFPVGLERGRIVSNGELGRAGRATHRRGFSDSFSSRRSSSTGRRREPSPLRNLVLTEQETRVVDGLQIPTCVPEVEMEDVLSPGISLHGNKIGDNIPISEHKRSKPNTPSVDVSMRDMSTSPAYNKDLPELPTYLIVQPLFARSEEKMEQTIPSLYHPEFEIPLPESPELSNEEDLETQSPTFSSIHSGACTPHRLSWPLLDERSGTESTASTYRLPDANPFAEGKERSEPQERQLSQMEMLIDEFEYLGAALI